MQPDYQLSTFVGAQQDGPRGAPHWVFLDEGPDAATTLRALSNTMSQTLVLLENPAGRSHGAPLQVQFFEHGQDVLRCGSGTLAVGWVLSEHYGKNPPPFIHTACETLQLFVDDEGYGYESLPLPQHTWSSGPTEWEPVIGQTITNAVLSGGEQDYLILELKDEAALTQARPDSAELTRMTDRALILTAPTPAGYRLRYFAPQYGLSEGGATGSANIQLLRYWYSQGQRGTLNACQCSPTGAEFWGTTGPDAVRLYGRVRPTGTG